MSLIVCTMAQCQTTAGCICGRDREELETRALKEIEALRERVLYLEQTLAAVLNASGRSHLFPPRNHT